MYLQAYPTLWISIRDQVIFVVIQKYGNQKSSIKVSLKLFHIPLLNSCPVNHAVVGQVKSIICLHLLLTLPANALALPNIATLSESLAYKPPIKLPMLVPPTKSIGIPASSNALITP